MASDKDDASGKRRADDERQKRLSAALRANLRRRKDQSRQREDGTGRKERKPPRDR